MFLAGLHRHYLGPPGTVACLYDPFHEEALDFGPYEAPVLGTVASALGGDGLTVRGEVSKQRGRGNFKGGQTVGGARGWGVHELGVGDGEGGSGPSNCSVRLVRWHWKSRPRITVSQISGRTTSLKSLYTVPLTVSVTTQ